MASKVTINHGIFRELLPILPLHVIRKIAKTSSAVARFVIDSNNALLDEKKTSWTPDDVKTNRVVEIYRHNIHHEIFAALRKFSANDPEDFDILAFEKYYNQNKGFFREIDFMKKKLVVFGRFLFMKDGIRLDTISVLDEAIVAFSSYPRLLFLTESGKIYKMNSSSFCLVPTSRKSLEAISVYKTDKA
jgi:hypothetical protein